MPSLVMDKFLSAPSAVQKPEGTQAAPPVYIKWLRQLFSYNAVLEKTRFLMQWWA
jgi:hypothetical protein